GEQGVQVGRPDSQPEVGGVLEQLVHADDDTPPAAAKPRTRRREVGFTPESLDEVAVQTASWTVGQRVEGHFPRWGREALGGRPRDVVGMCENGYEPPPVHHAEI